MEDRRIFVVSRLNLPDFVIIRLTVTFLWSPLIDINGQEIFSSSPLCYVSIGDE